MRLRSGIRLWQWAMVLVSIGALSVVAATGASAAAGCAHPRGSHPCCQPASGQPPRASSCLTIAASPNSSTAGQLVLISGRLRGRRHANAVVLLWRRFPGSKQFQVTEVTRTDGSGGYSMAARDRCQPVVVRHGSRVP